MARRETKYGRRPDGSARNPWRNQGDAKALGYRNVNDFRVQHGASRGLSPPSAVGHARPGEASATDLHVVRREGSAAPIDVLRRAALANGRARLSGLEKFSLRSVSETIESLDDVETLLKMATVTRAQWQDLATHQIPGNPFFYH